MITFRASRYDGRTSAGTAVEVDFLPPDQLCIRGPGGEERVSLAEVRVTSRLANIPRCLHLPGGVKCETADNEAVDALLAAWGGNRRRGLVHLLESRLRYVVLALLLALAALWALVRFGVPILAKWVAFAVPVRVETQMGQETLRLLDGAFFAPSRLTEDRKAPVRSSLAEISRDTGTEPACRLELRKGGRMGPNALALPSGIVVVTDELVDLARHPDEVTAVLAHEVGHVRGRHALRMLLQSSAAVLLISGITGDIASMTALASGLPTLLVNTGYSRDFEREADRFARRYMRRKEIPIGRLSDLLVRMEEENRSMGGIPPYLSTHPSTAERVRLLQDDGA